MKRMLLIGFTVQVCFGLSPHRLKTLERVHPHRFDGDVNNLRHLESSILRHLQNPVGFIAYSYAVLVPHEPIEAVSILKNNVILLWLG